MALPASEDTRANQMVYVIREEVDHVMATNDSGGDLSQGDFAIVGPYAAIADEDISSAATGSIYVEEGIQVQASNLTTGEDTFGTFGQEVYWDGTDFSDTETVGYYLVGYLTETKNSNGVIEFEKLRYAELIAS